MSRTNRRKPSSDIAKYRRDSETDPYHTHASSFANKRRRKHSIQDMEDGLYHYEEKRYG
jgi:hypothetical protein